MKRILIQLFVFFIFFSICYSQQENKNKIAVTIDDLPLQRIDSYKNNEYEVVFNKLIEEVKKQNTYAIGFVIESKLYTDGKPDKNKIQLLENLLDAGLELGNHTFAHKNPHKVPLAEYEEDILKGETIIKELLQKRGKQVKYFRHPFLNTGLSLEVKNDINNFLSAHGYTIAPVTVDNSEWIFSKAYDDAYQNNDSEMLKNIGSEYISYMGRKLEYYEGRSNVLFGRNISHILLIHANRLNSEYYGALCNMIRNRNYQFVSLDEALKDDAYKSEDKFVRNAGISWMDRWALALGKKKDFFAGEPPCPEYIMKYAKIESE
jgi:peptidoglycan/xylan/chitin deacetylase (PgdA/CDA1 family)